MADHLGEGSGDERLEGDDNPPRFGLGVQGVALAEGHEIPEAPVEPPLDIGDEDGAGLVGGQVLGINGHRRGV
jgi:hypothetical protein